jgi:YD repeat-containing protein
VRHTWDINGRPIETTYLDASGHQVDRILRSFDSVGNLRSLTATGVELRFDHDVENRRVAEHHRQANIVIAYERNAAGAVSAQTSPQLAEFRIERSYDSYDRLIALRSAAGEVLLSRDALGQVTSASLPNQVRYRASYDSRGRLVSHRYVGPGDTTFYFEQLKYDELGRIVEVRDSSGTHTYGYDELDQLVLASHPWGQERFEYDAAGNPTRVGERTARFDAAGQSVGGTEPLTWDGAGRLLGAEDGSWRLSWNPVGQLVGYADGPPAAGLTQRHRYLPPELGGLHIAQEGDGVSSWSRQTLWSQDNPLLDLSAEGTATTTYLAGDVLDEVYAIQRPNSKGRPRTLTLLRDHLGSVVGTVGGDGPGALVRYGAYGQPWPPTQEPSAVSTSVTLAGGLNGLYLPCQPRTAGQAWTVRELGAALGASVLVWTQPGPDGRGQFRHWVAGLAGDGGVVRAGQTYWAGVAGAGRSLQVSGPAPLESLVTAELDAGLNLVSVPARVAATHTSAELLALTGSGFAATPVPGAGGSASRCACPVRRPGLFARSGSTWCRCRAHGASTGSASRSRVPNYGWGTLDAARFR